MTELEYHEDLTLPQANENLWRTVLMAAIEDALTGAQVGSSKAMKIRETYEARAYITAPDRGFDEVCYLAGFDPVAVRDRLLPQIAAAPTPEQLFADRKPMKSQSRAMSRKPRRRSGVVSDLQPLRETGAWGFSQNSSNIRIFSEGA